MPQNASETFEKRQKKSVKFILYAFPLNSAIKIVMTLVNSVNNLLQLQR
jgi:hypothetical protein